MRKIVIFHFLLMFVPALSHAAETFSLSTYYPAPFGAYSKLKLVPQSTLTSSCAAGEMYVDTNNVLYFCQVDQSWGYPIGIWTQTVDQDGFPVVRLTDNSTDLFVGIGDQTPDAVLEISNSGTNNNLLMLSKDDSGDGNLMIVKGNGLVGIGTSNPSSTLDVKGSLKVENAITIGDTTSPVAGTIRWTGTDFEGYNGSQWISLSTGGNLQLDDMNCEALGTDVSGGVVCRDKLVGGTHDAYQCSQLGGSMYTDGSNNKFCKLNGTNVSCPSGWTQFQNWQRYSVAEWDGDDCGRHKSTGPVTFSNVQGIIHWSRGCVSGCCGSVNGECVIPNPMCWSMVASDNDWIRPQLKTYPNGLGTAYNTNGKRIEIGCN